VSYQGGHGGRMASELQQSAARWRMLCHCSDWIQDLARDFVSQTPETWEVPQGESGPNKSYQTVFDAK